MDVLVNLSIMFMLTVLCISGWKLTVAMRMKTMAALGSSVSHIYIILPVSAGIMLVHVLARTLALIAPGGKKE